MSDTTTNDETMSPAGPVLAFTGCLLAAAAGSALRAYVVVHLWRWFIVPLGLPHIGFWLAFGLLTLAGQLRGYRPRPGAGRRAWVDIFGNILGGVVFTILGWTTGAIVAGVMT